MSGTIGGMARGAVRVLFVALLCALTWGLAASSGSAHAAKRPAVYKAVFTGRAVKFDLSGFEPDFDPIYAVIIDASLRDTHAGGSAVPTSKLVLSMYLESFKPDTTPVLPDLLHPDRNVAGLVGYLHGAAVLVNAGGRTVYSGSMLAEIIHDSSMPRNDSAVHLISLLFGAGANSAAPPLRLDGSFTLFAGGREAGTLYAVRAGASTAAVTTPAPLPAGAAAALSVPPAHMPSWQQVVQGLNVALPPMMGTGGSSGSGGTAPAGTAPAGTLSLPSTQVRAAPTAVAAPASGPAGITVGGFTLTPPLIVAVVLVVAVALLPWERLLARKRPGTSTAKAEAATSSSPIPDVENAEAMSGPISDRPGAGMAPESAAKQPESRPTPPE